MFCIVVGIVMMCLGDSWFFFDDLWSFYVVLTHYEVFENSTDFFRILAMAKRCLKRVKAIKVCHQSLKNLSLKILIERFHRFELFRAWNHCSVIRKQGNWNASDWEVSDVVLRRKNWDGNLNLFTLFVEITQIRFGMEFVIIFVVFIYWHSVQGNGW